jgi:glycosyltransferase involved in cell wall biosynthesis
MNITIDLRSIQKGIISGVETYTYRVVEEILKLDKENKYKLFYNGVEKISFPELHFLNASHIQKRWPNKLLALTTQFGFPKFEKYIGFEGNFWMPNLNHVALSPKTKLILTVHDISPFARPEFYNLKRRLWHWSSHFGKLVRRADKILAVSEFTKQDLINKFNIPAGKVFVTPLGVNSEVFNLALSEDKLRQVRNSYALPGNFILYLGTLEPRKNVAGLIKAFDRVQSDVHLVIAGRQGWKYGEIFDAASKSPKKNKIQFLGFVEEGDKPYLMKLASAFAFPSFYEGFGLPVLEAMALGVPVLTSSITSLPEVAGDAALLVNPYNIDEMAFGLDQLLIDQDLRNSLVAKGLQRSAEFTWQRCAEETLKVLNS